MESYRHRKEPKASPGTSAEVLIFQDSDGVTVPPRPNAGGSRYTAVSVAFKLSAAVTVLHKWGPSELTADADMATINNSGSGDASTGGAFWSKTFQLRPGRNRISVVAGESAPAADYIAWELYSGPLPFTGTLA